MIELVFLALAVASVTITLTRSTLFEPLRAWVDNRSELLGELIYCPYCTSHYISFVAVLLFQPVVATSGVHVFDLIASAFAMITFSALFCGLILKSFEVTEED